MQRQIKFTNVSHDQRLQAYAEEKLVHLEKFVRESNHSVLAVVELARTTGHHKTGDIFRAEINLTIDSKLLRAEATAADLFAALDLAKDEIVSELKRFYGKQDTLLKRGGRALKNLLRGFYRK